jgi:propionyl-CoA synthetase
LFSFKNLGPPGCSGRPCPGYNLHLFSSDVKSVEEEECSDNELGRIVLKLPLPPGCFTTLWNNDELFHKLYFTRYPGYYDTMDVGVRTEDGFIETSARADDVLNVAGHRLSGGHIEQAIVESGKVSECAVVGLKDDVKGQQPFAFIVLNKAEENTEYVPTNFICNPSNFFFLKFSRYRKSSRNNCSTRNRSCSRI